MIKELTTKDREAIQAHLKAMTLRELIGQTAIWHIGRLPFQPDNPDSVSDFLAKYPVGAIFVADMKNPIGKTMSGFISESVACFQSASKIPLLAAGDLEHGGGSAARELTRFPDMMAIGSANDRDLDYLFGKHTAADGTSIGFNWSFSPVVDLSKNWLNPIVSNRSLGDDPERVAAAGAAIITGMQDHGMAACAKHFPGDGVDFLDQHICTSVNSLPEEEWYTTYGEVYKKVIGSGVYSIMIGHIALPFADAFNKEKGRFAPATVSKPIVSGLLRDRFGFEGLIVSDALDMGGYTGWDVYKNRIIASLNSGIDAMLWPGVEYFDIVEAAISDNSLKKERIFEAAMHVMELKARLGLLGEIGGINKPVPAAAKKEVDEVAMHIADKSISLVRNREAILPLNPEKAKKILIGDMSKITNGRAFPTDLLIEKLRTRGLEVHIIEHLDPVSLQEERHRIGTDWDAFLMPFFLRTHGLINTVRPVGEAARAIWSVQMLDELSPIFISFSTPYLLHDMPYMKTYVNAYSYNEYSVDALVRALFGELAFNEAPPIANFDPLRNS